MDKLPSLAAIGEQAVRRRKEAGLSQKALAELAGVGHVTVIALEKGEGALRLENAWRILGALGMAEERPEDSRPGR
ncbi:MAG: helix-turn-helix domain-containing protein [Alphaproteobacteria bacterium]|nr:helix-turn-helix domain-containing protein [Alphaproteobacteria bacterium]